MKIGVISDTHLSGPTTELRRLARGLLSDTELILHAGDLVQLAVLDVFADKEVVAVYGNKDHPLVCNQLPQHAVVEARGYRIGLIHGSGRVRGIEERVIEQFSDVHCIVYGHTHQPVNRILQGILMFNPGSFKTNFPFIHGRSIGILTIDNGLSGEIITSDRWGSDQRAQFDLIPHN